MAYNIPIIQTRDSECEHPNSFFLTPNTYLLIPFWFACFWAIVGMIWRPPLASAVLIVILLVFIIGIEWTTRRLISKKAAIDVVPKKEFAEPPDESVQQQVIRSKTPAGLDRLDGTFLAEFLPGAMTATVHVPFCPAFGQIPNVQVFPADESDTSLRVVSLKTFGMRVDVKRNNSAFERIRFVVIVEG